MRILSLRNRYLILFSTFTLTLILMFSLAVYSELQTLHHSIAESSQQKVNDSLANEVVSRGEVLSSAIATHIAYPVNERHRDEIHKQLKLITSTPLVRQAIVYDINGYILHDGTSGIDYANGTVMPHVPEGLSLQQPGQQRLFDQVIIHQPIIYQETRIGGILLWITLKPFHHSVREIEQTISEIFFQSEQQFFHFLLYLFIAFAAIILLLSSLISHGISKPVKALMQYSRDLAQGACDLPGILNQRDEFSRLGYSFRNMAIEIRKHLREIEQLAFTDSLTAVGNRTLFDYQVKEYLRQSPKGEFTLVMLDLDDFKWFNETRGLYAGDQLLKDLAQHCQTLLEHWSAKWSFAHKDGHVIRFGSDEFGILLLAPTCKNSLDDLEERLRSLFNPATGKSPLHGIKASMGIATYPDDGLTPEDVLNHASLALHEAKSQGQNRIVYYQAEMNNRLQRRYEIEQALQSAMSRDELYMIYQPQTNLQTGQIIGYEALMRWQHTEMDFISPAEFIPIAEQSPVIQELGEFVIEQVLQDIPRICQAHGHPVKVSLNVSAAQFFYHDVAELILRKVNEYAIAPETLCVELTETALLESDEIVTEQLLRLRQADINILLDDFGTGYASLSYLKSFPITGLKIDRSYTSRLCSGEPADFALFESLQFLAHNLGLSTVVEGIENERQEIEASRAGSIIAQGFKYGKGLPVEKLLESISERQVKALVQNEPKY